MAISKIASAGITADFDNTLTAADIADDAIGTAELANDVVINTSGAITTTGGMTVDGATVFNEASADVDFRIEGNTGANLFFVDAGNDRIGIGTAVPANDLEIGAYSGDKTLCLTSSANGNSYIRFNDGDSSEGMFIKYTGGANTSAMFMHIGSRFSSDTNRMTVTGDGEVGIGIDSPVENLHLAQSDSDKNYIQFTNSTTGHTAADGISIGMGDDEALVIYQRQANSIIFGTSASTRMTINSTGIVTINCASDSVERTFMVKDRGTNGSADGRYPFRVVQKTGDGSILFLRGDGRLWIAETLDENSDENMKENISYISTALSIVNDLKPATFDRKEEYGGSKDHAGFIAQDVEDVLPHAVSEGVPETGNMKALHYNHFIPYLTKAIQELSAKNDALEAKITALENA